MNVIETASRLFDVIGEPCKVIGFAVVATFVLMAVASGVRWAMGLLFKAVSEAYGRVFSENRGLKLRLSMALECNEERNAEVLRLKAAKELMQKRVVAVFGRIERREREYDKSEAYVKVPRCELLKWIGELSVAVRGAPDEEDSPKVAEAKGK